jgi:phosphoribosyl-ATP pyrophosphohydrolase
MEGSEEIRGEGRGERREVRGESSQLLYYFTILLLN